jgi:signal recognition particle subunit SRP54
MFENLSNRLSEAARSLSGKGRLTEANIKDTLRQLRLALLEADVALPVVRSFIERIREQAVGAEVSKSLTPGQALVRLIHDELVRLFGTAHAPLDLRAQPPVVVLLAGLQGAGKTTSAAKLAKRLIDKDGKRVMLVSVDVHRPAAILQLETLAREVGAMVCPTDGGDAPTAIVDRALSEARRSHAEVLIVDTAGRLHIDADMMAEVEAVHARSGARETLFVVDSMAGQDAVNAATAFDRALPLTGVVLTKADGDARGGVALSVLEVTGKPIRFVGVGEKVDALEPFHPERMASRILGMGDVASLVEDIQDKVSRDKAEKLAQKVRKGRGFDLADLRDQFEQMLNMGGLAAMLEKLPMAAKINPAALGDAASEKRIRRQVAIIDSMTPGERRQPKSINGSRKRRIAAGCGQQIQDVNRLLRQFTRMEKTMRKMSRGGMQRMLRGLGGRGLPPGLG